MYGTGQVLYFEFRKVDCWEEVPVARKRPVPTREQRFQRSVLRTGKAVYGYVTVASNYCMDATAGRPSQYSR